MTKYNYFFMAALASSSVAVGFNLLSDDSNKSAVDRQEEPLSLYEQKSAVPEHVYQKTICTGLYGDFIKENERLENINQHISSFVPEENKAWYKGYLKAAYDHAMANYTFCTSFEGHFEPHPRTAEQSFLASDQKADSCVTLTKNKTRSSDIVDRLRPIYDGSVVFNNGSFQDITHAVSSPKVTTVNVCMFFGNG